MKTDKVVLNFNSKSLEFYFMVYPEEILSKFKLQEVTLPPEKHYEIPCSKNPGEKIKITTGINFGVTKEDLAKIREGTIVKSTIDDIDKSFLIARKKISELFPFNEITYGGLLLEIPLDCPQYSWDSNEYNFLIKDPSKSKYRD